MKIDGTPYRSIWLAEDGWSLRIIDQTKLPWSFEILTLETVAEAAHAQIPRAGFLKGFAVVVPEPLPEPDPLLVVVSGPAIAANWLCSNR